MSGLSNPDMRRALRAVIQALLALALIGLLYWITRRVANDSSVLTEIVRGALVILGLGEIFYGAENVTRAIRLTGPGGFGAEFGAEGKSLPVEVKNPPSSPVPTTPIAPPAPPLGPSMPEPK